MKNIFGFKKLFFSNFLIIAVSFSLVSNLSAEKQKRINVVLIVVDSLRAGHLGCYGYSLPTSPNIDKFSKEGVLFARAFSQGSCTGISVPSILTSLYPGVHRAGGTSVRLADKFITLSEIMSKEGYATALLSVPLEGLVNFESRFQNFDISNFEPGLRKLNFESRLLPSDVRHFETGLSKATPKINKKAAIWLKQHQDQPFFLYIHYPGLHSPYLAPPPYDTIFWQKDVSDEMKGVVASFSSDDQGEYAGGPLKRDMLDFIISQYDGLIRYTDVYIGGFLDDLEKLGLSKNTLVILIADHGEGFFEHGKFFHGNSLYDETLHVPLIMRLPETLPQGKIIPDMARLIDIMPTVLDVLDIRNANIMQGVSLLPLVKGETASLAKVDSFSEAHLLPLKGVRTDRWAFSAISADNGDLEPYELYDLENDKSEMNNLVKQNLQEVNVFMAKLKDYNDSSKRLRVSLLGEGFIDEPLIMDEKEKEILRSLGYAQ